MDSDLEELLLFVQEDDDIFEDEVLQSGTIPDTQCLFGYEDEIHIENGIKVVIVNIATKFKLNVVNFEQNTIHPIKLNLQAMCLKNRNITLSYDHKRFKVGQLAIEDRIIGKKRCVVRIFPTGTISFPGQRTENATLYMAHYIVGTFTEKFGYPFVLTNFTILNYVGKMEVGFKINLKQMAKDLHCKYNPKGDHPFPSLIFKPDIQQRYKFIIPVSGKVLVVGIKNRKDLYPCCLQMYRLCCHYKLYNDNVQKIVAV